MLSKSVLRNKNTVKKVIPKVLVVALSLVALLIVLEMTHVINLQKTRKEKGYETQPSTPTRTVSAENKGEVKKSNDVVSKENATYGDDKSETNIISSSQQLIDPYGTFVSNHRPRLGANQGMEQSVCNTTPGAICIIMFQKGSEILSLPEQRTDRGGAAYWTWDLQDIGLSEGTWTVVAKAQFGGFEKTSQDSAKLEVSK